MMEATPSASFIMPEPDLLLELLIVALDAPAQLGGVNQIAECDVARQGRKPIPGRFLLPLGPLNQQPFFCWFAGPYGPMQRGHAHAQTARTAIHWCPPAIG